MNAPSESVATPGVSEAGVGEAALPRPAKRAPPAWAHPKNLITAFITLILVIGEWNFGIVGGYPKLVVTLGTCVLVEVVLSRWLRGTWPQIQSAYISGVSLAMLVRPAGGLWWPFVVGAALSIGSKYVLHYRGRHLWNPSNLGLAALVLLAPTQVALLSHEFGNAWQPIAIIWIVGVLVASRAKILHVSATYVACFLLLAALRSAISGTSFYTEAGPLSGPMYQLMVFFMMTDPRTTVSTVRGRMVTVALIAVLECIFRIGNDFDLAVAAPFAVAPPILALAIVGPIALYIDLRRKAAGGAH